MCLSLCDYRMTVSMHTLDCMMVCGCAMVQGGWASVLNSFRFKKKQYLLLYVFVPEFIPVHYVPHTWTIMCVYAPCVCT